ncbi:hypothetical protein RN001_000846 [Aquatica leii]|uniref:Uncharacterized protein n=1 Tax=Aquatica leii TaxID=1421715 RepID=A0AAN7PAM4_9COLE|nr:hypothetical protein RN001_000846 [Aquatica leii]
MWKEDVPIEEIIKAPKRATIVADENVVIPLKTVMLINSITENTKVDVLVINMGDVAKFFCDNKRRRLIISLTLTKDHNL